ncbi:MAG: DUF547 domain-containing protein [Halolamina sp.]|uniref:DUF547 domain-containing protein n=1 Tax=Halolamina sp. TaxID=1940283 RepID=UPI002FC2EB21
MSDRDPTELASTFLAAVKRGTGTAGLRSTLAGLPEAAMAALDVSAAKAFWLNTYNAYAQYHLERKPELYDSRRRFFGGKRLRIAGKQLSLDDVEHGILRASASKYGLGYLPRPFPSAFERSHRLPTVDPRIHFALNCGAESCPPILAYSAESVDEELEWATEGFLESNASRDDEGVVWLSRLFLYYRGDFGGRSGIYDFLERYAVVHPGERPTVRYQEYDWTLNRGMYRE